MCFFFSLSDGGALNQTEETEDSQQGEVAVFKDWSETVFRMCFEACVNNLEHSVNSAVRGDSNGGQ